MSTEQEPVDSGEREHTHRRETDPPATLVEATARELGRLALVAGQRVEAVEKASQEIHQSMERLAVFGESVDRLATALMVGVASKADLETAEKNQDRKRRRVVLIGSVVTAFMVALAVVNVVTLIQSYNQRRILIECTTPSRPGDVHECYENGQAQQQKAIQQIIDALKAAK